MRKNNKIRKIQTDNSSAVFDDDTAVLKDFLPVIISSGICEGTYYVRKDMSFLEQMICLCQQTVTYFIRFD